MRNVPAKIANLNVSLGELGDSVKWNAEDQTFQFTEASSEKIEGLLASCAAWPEAPSASTYNPASWLQNLEGDSEPWEVLAPEGFQGQPQA